MHTRTASDFRPMSLPRVEFKVSYVFVDKELSMEYIIYATVVIILLLSPLISM